jgi:hypothetical protein
MANGTPNNQTSHDCLARARSSTSPDRQLAKLALNTARLVIVKIKLNGPKPQKTQESNSRIRRSKSIDET